MIIINWLGSLNWNSLLSGILAAAVSIIASWLATNRQIKRQIKAEKDKQQASLNRYCYLLRSEIITAIYQINEISKATDTTKCFSIISANSYNAMTEVFERLSLDEAISLHRLYSQFRTISNWIDLMGDTREITRAKGYAEGICMELFGEKQMDSARDKDITELLMPRYKNLLDKLKEIGEQIER